MPQPDSHTHTTPPAGGRPVILYDGNCPFCTRQAGRLAAFARGKFALRSFHDAKVLDEFPGITFDACMQEMKIVEADGRIYGGVEAVVRAIDAGHPVVGKILYGYYVPGIRQLADAVYRWIAVNRYRFGRRPPDGPGSCPRHRP